MSIELRLTKKFWCGGALYSRIITIIGNYDCDSRFAADVCFRPLWLILSHLQRKSGFPLGFVSKGFDCHGFVRADSGDLQ